ncbi:MAG: DUF2797 domain-containing protein [Bdellovibrionales bacterium]|nr:DUF2797 domain-containing protein [Bdellovibrionales bacterium]
MKFTGPLSKMVSYSALPIQYQLMLGEVPFDLTKLIGSEVKLSYSGKIFCANCGKKTKKSYNQGFCFPCTIKLAECDLCILKPETCHYDKGTCREPAWGEENCMKPHVVYLANSSGIKVGITRRTQVPTRWIDQGATQALAILEVKKRITSGLVEVLFKKHVADKTDWRKMLKGPPEEVNLQEWKVKLLELVSEELKGHEYTILDEPEQKFNYPVNTYPEKVTSINLDKIPEISSKLVGIKGQYLIFEAGVLNVRSHSGYEVTIEGEHATSTTENHSS